MFKLKSKKWLTFPRILVLLLLALVVFLFTVLYYGTVSEEVDLLSDDTHRLPIRRKRYIDESLVDYDLLNSPDIERYTDMRAHVRDKRDKMRLDELEREYSLCKKMIPKEDKGCMKTFSKMYKLAKEISEKMESMKKMFHDSELLLKHDSSDTSYEKYAELIENEKFDWKPISSSPTPPSSVTHGTTTYGAVTREGPSSSSTTSVHHSSSVVTTEYEETTVPNVTESHQATTSNPDIIRGVPSKEKLDVKYGGCQKSKSRKTNHTDTNIGTLIFGRTSGEEVDDCEDIGESIENLVDSKEHLPSTKYTTTTRSIKPNETIHKYSEENSSEEHHSTTVESIVATTNSKNLHLTSYSSHTTSEPTTEKVYNISESTTTVNNTTQEYTSAVDILATNMTTETTPYQWSTESVVTEKTTETTVATDISTCKYDSPDISTKGYHVQSTDYPSTAEMKPITEFLSTTKFESVSTTDYPSTTEMKQLLITEIPSTTETKQTPTTDSSSTREMNLLPITDSTSTTEMKEPSTTYSSTTTEMKEPPTTEISSTSIPVLDSSSTTELNPSKRRNLDEEKLQEVLSWKKKFEEVSAKHNQELEALLSQIEPGVLDKAGLKISRVHTELIGEFSIFFGNIGLQAFCGLL